MALVDYSSDSSSESGGNQQPKNTPRTRSGQLPTSTQTTAAAALPPLPPTFHDLYASTVRPSAVDDPALHQGRTRLIPHVAGNWPSHLYVEWHPTAAEHELLIALVAELRGELSASATVNSSLASDLGASQPLHISLSRPFVLTTAEKDGFLDRLVDVIGRCGVSPFEVSPVSLRWHHSPDSNRAFLVLGVQSAGGGDYDGKQQQQQQQDAKGNPELMALLTRCNDLVTSVGQPALYDFAPNNSAAVAEGGATAASSAFHVSIAWAASSAELSDDVRQRTADVFEKRHFGREVRRVSIPVARIKAKIGNVVTSITLPNAGLRK